MNPYFDWPNQLSYCYFYFDILFVSQDQHPKSCIIDTHYTAPPPGCSTSQKATAFNSWLPVAACELLWMVSSLHPHTGQHVAQQTAKAMSFFHFYVAMSIKSPWLTWVGSLTWPLLWVWNDTLSSRLGSTYAGLASGLDAPCSFVCLLLSSSEESSSTFFVLEGSHCMLLSCCPI